MRQSRPASCPFVVLRVSSVKHPILKKGEPRMNTNGHEDRWTCLAATTSWDEGRERGRPARTTLAQPRPSSRPGSTGNAPTIPLQPSPWGSRRQGDRAPITEKRSGHPTQRMRARRPRSRRGASSHPSCSARRHCPCRCGRAALLRGPSSVLRVSSVKHSIVNKDEPRMDTNGHEDRWTCLAATTSRDEGRERGRLARTTLAQAYPSLPPGSTGNGATIPIQPSPWGSRR